MPLLGGLIQSLFGALAGFLLKAFAAKVAARVAAIGVFVALSGGLLAAFNLVVAPFLGQLFNTEYGQFLGLAFPPIAGTCMAAIAAVWVAVQTYRLQVAALRIAASV